MISGQVVYGPTHRPLAGTWVVLHQVGKQGRGGPIDSVRTRPQGRFTLTIPQPDTAALYVVSTWYGGIAYFSEPVPPGRGPATLQPIPVYDTASSGPPIEVSRRLVSVARPKEDGTRAVLELVALTNPGRATRVTNDTLRPTWVGVLPHDALQFDVGEGDIAGESVSRRGDSVVVLGPIPPGDPKQVSYTYNLPATTHAVTIPMAQPTGELDLLLEDTTTVVTAPGLESAGVQAIDGRPFAIYRRRGVPASTAVVLTFPRGAPRPESLIPYVIGLLAVALAGGLVVALRRPLAPRESAG